MCFIGKDEVEWEDHDWGQLGWIVRPAKVPEATGLTILDVVIQPGSGHNFHVHPNQQETIYVVEGRIQQWVEAEATALGAHEAVFIPANTVHATFVSPDAADSARLLVALGPSHTDAGYEAVDVSTQEPWASMTTVIPR